eukprot:6460670-Amphidinium_carterae.3
MVFKSAVTILEADMPPISAPYRPTLCSDLAIRALLTAGNPKPLNLVIDCLKVMTPLRCTGHLQATH